MADKKQSIYCLTLSIIKITLRVRFPCSVCCTIKLAGQEHDIPGEKELQNGEAILNLTYSSELALPHNIPLDRKFLLYVYLKSSSGRIPAGSIPLSLARASQQAHREVSRIDKCPDKSAFIVLEIRLQRMDEKRQLTSATTHEREVKPLRHEPSLKNIQLVKSVSPDKGKEDKNGSFRYLVGSQVDIGSPREPRLNKRYSKREEEGKSSILENYYSKGEHEKAFGVERDVETFKGKILILENEINSKNNRWSQLEKEHKQLQKKCEQLEIDLRSVTSKAEYAEKANREMAAQLRQAKEKAEQEKLNYQNVIKRIQIRQSSCKEQIKSFSEKLYASENEKQRMVFQKNLSSNQFQGREKKLREAFKEKEKKMLEERTQLLKKIDSLEKDAEKYKQEIGDAKSKNSDSIQQVHELKLLIEKVGSEKQRFRGQCNDFKFELTKLKNEKRILQESLESIGKFNEERRSFRKQLGDKDLQNSQLKDKMTVLEAQISRLKSQNEQLDKIGKERSSQLKALERNYNAMARDINILEADLADRDTKISLLMQELKLEMKRNQFYQGSVAEIEEQFELKQDAIEHELKQSQNYKIMLEEELEKLGQQLEMTQQQLSNTTKDLQELEQIVEEKGQWIANLESQMIQLNNLNQQWQMQKIELAEDKKELQEKYHILVEETQEIEKKSSKKIIQITEQSEENISNLQNSLKDNVERVKSLNKVLKEKEDYLSAIISSNNLLEKQLKASFAEKEKIIAKEQSLRSQNSHLNEIVSTLKKEVEDKDIVVDSLRRSIESTEKEFSELEKINIGLATDHHNLQAANRQLKESNILYQQATFTVLASLMINLKQTTTKVELVHEDPELLSQANQLLSKILENNRGYIRAIKDKQEKIIELQLQIDLLKQQRDKKEESLLQTSHHIELLRKNTNEYSQQIQQKNSNIKGLGLALKQKQEDLSILELETSKRIMALNSIISQKNTQLSQLKQKHLEQELQLEKVISELANTNNQLKKIEKDKRNIETDQKNKITLIGSSLRAEMERVNLLQKDKGQLEKQLRQEKQNLRKLMRELQSKCYECEDLQMKLEELDSVGQLRQSEIRKLKETNTQFKQLFDSFFHSEISYSQNEAPFNPKIEKYLSEPTSKDGEFLKQKAKIFYQSELALFNNSIQLKSNNNFLSTSVQNLTAQLERVKAEAAKGQTSLAAQLEDLHLQLEEVNKLRGRQSDAKLELMKAIDQQKQSLELLRRFIEEFSKQIFTLEKEKKLSVFVLPPVKQSMKKIEEQMAAVTKVVNAIFIKNKREWDLANLRAKKNANKKIESVRIT